MNSGIIATRYATALWKLVLKEDTAGEVYSQASAILKAFSSVPEFNAAISSPRSTTIDGKIRLLESCVAPDRLEPGIERLARLMDRNGRICHFRIVLIDFLNIYREANGIKMVQITTATGDESLLEAVGEIDREPGTREVVITHKVDPSIIGGFIYESWGKRLDCSIKGSLEKVREQLIEENKRLV